MDLHANRQRHDQRQVSLQIAQSAFVWKQRLVATAAVVPQSLVQAFLSAGAVAVVSRSSICKPDSSAAEIATYFRELYKALFEEQCSIIEAVKAAGEPSEHTSEHTLLCAQQYFAHHSWVCSKITSQAAADVISESNHVRCIFV